MIKTIAEKNQRKPVICISIFPFFMDVNINLRWPDRYSVCNPEDYRNVLQSISEELRLNNVYSGAMIS
jgi:hypothetical protein